MKTITNEKIEKLTKRLNDKKISRAEKKEIMEELNWEKFRADPRPVRSLGKDKLMDAMVYFGDMVIFGYMGIADNTPHKGFHASDIIMTITIAVLVAMCFVYLCSHEKYKTEPMDELAKQNMNKASRWAFYVLISIGIAFALIQSVINADGTTNIPNRSMLNLFAAVLFFYDFLANIIFVCLDRETAEEE